MTEPWHNNIWEVSYAMYTNTSNEARLLLTAFQEEGIRVIFDLNLRVFNSHPPCNNSVLLIHCLPISNRLCEVRSHFSAQSMTMVI